MNIGWVRFGIGACVIALMIGACGQRKAPYDLKVEARTRGIDLQVTNRNTFDWRECMVHANVMSVEAPGYRYKSDPSIAAGETVTLDGLGFTAGVNGGGIPLDPRILFNLGLVCSTPDGTATGAVVNFN